MADQRIKDIATTATAPSAGDFFAIDGAVNNTRKIAANSFLQDAPSDGDLYGRKSGAWSFAASPSSLPILPTFVYDSAAGDSLFVYGDIPNSWQSYNSNLTQLYIGNSATSIGASSFASCYNITGNLVIPNSVTSIGSSAFRYCGGFGGDLIIPNSVTSIGSSAFRYCSGLEGDLIIPNSVTSIGSYAFRFNNYVSLTIGTSVTSIGSYAFADGLISSVILTDGRTAIQDSFANSAKLSGSLTIPASVTSIGDYAFAYNLLTSIVIPDSITSIGQGAFRDNLITGVTIRNSATTIGGSAFAGCSGLTVAYLNQPIGSIGSYAFYATSITDVYIGPDATGYTLGSGQTIGDKSGITVSTWTNYPNVP
jgi:hypothetical protein